MGRLGHGGVVGVLIAVLIGTGEASGHGPCGGTGPAFEGENALEVETAPGERLVVMEPSIELVWNPDANDLRIDPPPEIAHDYVAGAPTLTLARAEKPKVQVITVPDVPAGRYLMVAYDGSEGGAHYTWDHVRVDGRQALPSAAAPDDGEGWLWAALAAAAGLAVGLLAGRARWPSDRTHEMGTGSR